MGKAADDDSTQLPQGCPEWMRAAVGKPFEELPERIQEWIEETELGLHYECAQDIKHCEDDLRKLASRRTSFREHETERSYLRMKIAATKTQQHQLVNAESADKLIVTARIFADRTASLPAVSGAPATSRGYQAADDPLLEEMHCLLRAGEVPNIWKAAQAVAPRAKGSKAGDSVTKRLVNKYQQKF